MMWNLQGEEDKGMVAEMQASSNQAKCSWEGAWGQGHAQGTIALINGNYPSCTLPRQVEGMQWQALKGQRWLLHVTLCTAIHVVRGAGDGWLQGC